uniref:FAD assembly factor SdhE n=1 Tax=Strongyloides venezuelensis TaxID=75913 RepID=A0A0K0FPV3_STRVS
MSNFMRAKLLGEKINFFAMKFQALGKLNDKQIKGLFNMIEDIVACTNDSLLMQALGFVDFYKLKKSSKRSLINHENNEYNDY